MTRLPMSPAANGLLRALLAGSGVRRDRILLTECHSTDWQALAFVGERHEIALRIPGPGAEQVADSLTTGLADREFHIGGQTVADIQLAARPSRRSDGSIDLVIEALTIAA